jgi:hypothetical protein
LFEDVGAGGWIDMARYEDVEGINLSQGTFSIGNFLTRKLTLDCHNSAVFVGCLNDHCLLKCTLLHGRNSSGDDVGTIRQRRGRIMHVSRLLTKKKK